MTRDQMHNTLRYVREQLADERGTDYSGVEALDMVLEELEQEPSGDLISRQAVLDGIEELKKSPWATDKRGFGFEYLIKEALEVVADLCVKQAPPVNPLSKDYNTIYYTPQPKTGHWIKDDITERSKSAYKHKCDRCGAYHRAMYDYCPSCGAKMIEPQESEDKE